MQAAGDGGQGWGNALLYIFLSPTMRTMIFCNTCEAVNTKPQEQNGLQSVGAQRNHYGSNTTNTTLGRRRVHPHPPQSYSHTYTSECGPSDEACRPTPGAAATPSCETITSSMSAGSHSSAWEHFLTLKYIQKCGLLFVCFHHYCKMKCEREIWEGDYTGITLTDYCSLWPSEVNCSFLKFMLWWSIAVITDNIFWLANMKPCSIRNDCLPAFSWPCTQVQNGIFHQCDNEYTGIHRIKTWCLCSVPVYGIL